MGAGTVHVGLTFSNGKSRQEARTPTRYLQLQTFSSACRIDEKGQEETSQRAAGTSVSPSQPPRPPAPFPSRLHPLTEACVTTAIAATGQEPPSDPTVLLIRINAPRVSPTIIA